MSVPLRGASGKCLCGPSSTRTLRVQATGRGQGTRFQGHSIHIPMATTDVGIIVSESYRDSVANVERILVKEIIAADRRWSHDFLCVCSTEWLLRASLE